MFEVRIYEVWNVFRLYLYFWYGYFLDDCVSFLILWFLFFINVDNFFSKIYLGMVVYV